MRGLDATPLIALDAVVLDTVVLDTETTGLDPASARLVEVAAVHLAGGRIGEAFRRFLPSGGVANFGIGTPATL